MKKKIFAVIYGLVIFSLVGCASPKVKMRYVWPPLPDEPKIEYLGVYNSASDIEDDSMLNKFLGRDAALFLKNPQMVAGDGHGRVFVTDLKLAGVVAFDFNTKTVTLLGGDGGVGLFKQPTGIAVDSEGFIYVADSEKRMILVFTPEGKPYRNIDLAQMKSLGFIAIDNKRKNIIVPDPKDHKVYIVDSKGGITASITNTEISGGGFNRPNAVAVAPNGDIVIADSYNARVVIYSPDGKYLSAFGERGDNPGQFNLIQGIAVDSSGHIYITDARENRFSIMNSKGDLLLPVGTSGDSSQHIGVFQVPFGISIDQNDTIYVVEKYFRRFQRYQYLTDAYLSKYPIKTESLAKPVDDGKKNSDKNIILPAKK